jgi:CRP/FNR family cyclic AMP-dependent transcriptional regulator
MSRLSLIADSPFLREIPTSFLPDLEKIAEIHRFPPGATIFSEGTLHPYFHVLATGDARLDMHVPRRGRVPILSVGPGDVLAWSALLGNGVMTSSALTLVPVQTVAFPGDKLRQLCEQQHEIGYHLMRQLAAALSLRLVATRLQLLDLFADHVPLDLTPAVGQFHEPEC